MAVETTILTMARTLGHEILFYNFLVWVRGKTQQYIRDSHQKKKTVVDFCCSTLKADRTERLERPSRVQDGAPKIAKLPYKWLYGRYNYSYWEL